jgi:hypothetical protein
VKTWKHIIKASLTLVLVKSTIVNLSVELEQPIYYKKLFQILFEEEVFFNLFYVCRQFDLEINNYFTLKMCLTDTHNITCIAYFTFLFLNNFSSDPHVGSVWILESVKNWIGILFKLTKCFKEHSKIISCAPCTNSYSLILTTSNCIHPLPVGIHTVCQQSNVCFADILYLIYKFPSYYLLLLYCCTLHIN